MKTKGLYIYCAILTAVLIIVAAAALVSDEWFKTSFKSVPEITMTVNEKDYVFPLIEHTAVKYKTSDSSYVLVTKGRFDELNHFYEKTEKLEVDESSECLFIDKDGIKYAVKRLSDDLDYVTYSVEAVN